MRRLQFEATPGVKNGGVVFFFFFFGRIFQMPPVKLLSQRLSDAKRVGRTGFGRWGLRLGGTGRRWRCGRIARRNTFGRTQFRRKGSTSIRRLLRRAGFCRRDRCVSLNLSSHFKSSMLGVAQHRLSLDSRTGLTKRLIITLVQWGPSGSW